MTKHKTHISFFFPIGLLSLAALPVILCWHLSSSGLFRQTYAIEFNLPVFSVDQLPEESSHMNHVLIRKFVFSREDFLQSTKVDELLNECSRIHSSRDSLTVVRVRLLRGCTYGDFVRVIDVFDRTQLFYKNLLNYESRYYLWGQLKPGWDFLPSPRSTDQLPLLNRLFLSFNQIFIILDEHPILFSIPGMWLVMVIVNIIQVRNITQQRRRLTSVTTALEESRFEKPRSTLPLT